MLPKNVSFAGTLDSEQLRMVELAAKGFHCSEVLLFMGLEAQGKTDPDLIRAVSGLAGGMGFSGETCGALTGGVCLLGLYAGRGSSEESSDPALNIMINELVEWFSKKFGESYGGILCRDITEDDPGKQPSRCPRIVASVHKKVKSLLSERGHEWNRARILDDTVA
jgi:C_GCAxxG_C_C family probable redox protein